MFSDGVLLITGGTGSFGNEVLNRIIDSNVKEIRIFSRDEKKQDDMRMKYNNDKINFIIGDVRDYGSVYHAMKGVDYIFHAAALKQVPSCEFNPSEAVRTNIMGTENVIDAAIENKVKKVVVLSTDKAVYPINAMGISKAMMEKIMLAKSKTLSKADTVLCCTRFGNVMCSRGSVIPLFIEQIVNGRDITVTNPKMTRFLMSLDDAVDLVLFAFRNGEQGDIFIQKSLSTTVQNLAFVLKDILQSDSNIITIGERHGEKLYETLVTKEEMVDAEDFGQYYKIKADHRNLNYGKYNISAAKSPVIALKEYSSRNTNKLSAKQLKALLLNQKPIQDALNDNIIMKKYGTNEYQDK